MIEKAQTPANSFTNSHCFSFVLSAGGCKVLASRNWATYSFKTLYDCNQTSTTRAICLSVDANICSCLESMRLTRLMAPLFPNPL